MAIGTTLAILAGSLGLPAIRALYNKVKTGSWSGTRRTSSSTRRGSGGGGVNTSTVTTPGGTEITEIKPGTEQFKFLERFYTENKENLDKLFGELAQPPEDYPELADLAKTSEDAFGQLPETPQLAPAELQEFNFGPIAEQARKQFQERTLPSLAERFTSLVGPGQQSSAFERQKAQAGVDLETGLAALQAQLSPQFAQQREKLKLQRGAVEQGLAGFDLQKQAMKRGDVQLAMQQLREKRSPLQENRETLLRLLGLQPQPNYAVQQGSPGFLTGLAGGIGQGLGYAAPYALKSLFGGA